MYNVFGISVSHAHYDFPGGCHYDYNVFSQVIKKENGNFSSKDKFSLWCVVCRRAHVDDDVIET